MYFRSLALSLSRAWSSSRAAVSSLFSPLGGGVIPFLFLLNQMFFGIRTVNLIINNRVACGPWTVWVGVDQNQNPKQVKSKRKFLIFGSCSCSCSCDVISFY
jgi:hypothetical protein